MSAQAVGRVIERATNDAAFRERCVTDPDRALGEFDLSPEEREALLSGEPERLQALGVDGRVAKRWSYWS